MYCVLYFGYEKFNLFEKLCWMLFFELVNKIFVMFLFFELGNYVVINVLDVLSFLFI